MAALLTPFWLALVVSLLFHLQAYWGLARIPPQRSEAPPADEPVEVQFALDGLNDPPVDPTRSQAEPPQPDPQDAPQPTPRPNIVREPEPLVTVAVDEAERPPPEADPAGRTAVTQQSTNPEPPPEDARFIAEQNNRVQQETVAEFRNDERDDPVQQLSPETSQAEVGEGNAEETAFADPDAPDSERESDTAPSLEAAVAAVMPGGQLPSESAQAPSGAEAPPAAPSSSRELLTVEDGAGSFTIPRAAATSEAASSGSGSSGTGSANGSSERREALLSALGVNREQPPNLQLSHGDLEAVVPRETLDAERESWQQRRRARLRGSNRGERWQQFRSAIENYVARVQPGNQTALNAAASPFAQYLAAMHRKIHRHFAHGFLGTLTSDPNHPLSDRSLHSRLEIILNRDGSVHRVGVVRQSGQLVFDQAAFTSVHNAAPYGNAPPGILSDDGYVYMHWGFYRNQRQCGTFNARPFLIQATPLQDDTVTDPPDAPSTAEEGSAS